MPRARGVLGRGGVVAERRGRRLGGLAAAALPVGSGVTLPSSWHADHGCRAACRPWLVAGTCRLLACRPLARPSPRPASHPTCHACRQEVNSSPGHALLPRPLVTKCSRNPTAEAAAQDGATSAPWRRHQAQQAAPFASGCCKHGCWAGAGAGWAGSQGVGTLPLVHAAPRESTIYTPAVARLQSPSACSRGSNRGGRRGSRARWPEVTRQLVMRRCSSALVRCRRHQAWADLAACWGRVT